SIGSGNCGALPHAIHRVIHIFCGQAGYPMSPAARYLRIAVPCPLYRLFDYLPPAGVAVAALQPGVRVRVPFGRQRVIGVLLETAAYSDLPDAKLRRAEAVLDDAPLIGP